MKLLLFCVFAILCGATSALYLTRETPASSGPVVYLAGSLTSLDAFQHWLARTGHPAVDLRVDAANTNASKIIIQGISGIGSDLIQTNFGADLGYLRAMGLLMDVTGPALAHGFGPETFAAAARSETCVDGRQYGYPSLLYVLMNYVNAETFETLGLKPPSVAMSFEDFEREGLLFVQRANPPGQKQRRFFCSGVSALCMRRSLGLDTFNETLTRCTLDDPRNAEVLKRIHRWTYEERLLPSAADMASFSNDGATAAAFGPRLYQFRQGNIAIINGGSYLVPALRQLGRMRLSVVEPPCEKFRNALFGASMVSIYAGSKHKDAAQSYLEFLNSPEYFDYLVSMAAGIPANPQAARREDFLRPPGYENEWGCNEEFVRAIDEIGIPYTSNPFVLFSIYSRADEAAQQRFMSGLLSAEEAGRRAASDINEEIRRTLSEQPETRAKYETLVQRQRLIEERRAKGEKVPLSWIENPFHRKYYQTMGWAE